MIFSVSGEIGGEATADGGDVSFEVSDAGFTCVVLNYGENSIVFYGKQLRTQAMLDELVAAEAESATFKVRNLDQSRFVEVQLEEPGEGERVLEQLIEGLPGMLPE